MSGTSGDCVVVIGAGLVGASIGMALVAAGYRVHLRDQVSSHAKVAASLGAGTTEKAAPGEVSLAIVAVPPAALAKAILGALDRYPQAVVTDVGSVKGAVLAELVASGADVSRYVGSHPMAGSQHAGPRRRAPTCSSTAPGSSPPTRRPGPRPSPGSRSSPRTAEAGWS